MVTRTKLLLAAALVTMTLQAQNYEPAYEKRDVNMPTEHLENNTEGSRLHDYPKYETGFWFSAEALGGYSANVSKGKHNTPFAEVDVYAGYRINEFARVGLGLGGRYYFDPDYLRRVSHNWAMPIMFNVRGNFIPQEYRTVVPYYSVDIGSSITDGFMFRPTIGIRCGERRSAFLLGVTYMMQNMRGLKENKETLEWDNATLQTSFFALRLGYEF